MRDALNSSPKIIRATDFAARLAAADQVAAAYRQADHVREATHREAQRVLDRAHDEAQLIRQEAYAQGVAQAQSERAAQLTAALDEWQRYVLTMGPKLSEMMGQIAHQFLAAAPPAERAAAAVRAGLASFLAETAVHLYVHPDVVMSIKDELAALRVAYPLTQVLSVQGDSRLDLSACRLMSPLGEHHASQTLYLESLARLLQTTHPRSQVERTDWADGDD